MTLVRYPTQKDVTRINEGNWFVRSKIDVSDSPGTNLRILQVEV